MKTKLIFLVMLLSFSCHQIYAYGVRGVNLGLTNFLDGGPLRPRPGLYWNNYNQYYHGDAFLDQDGNPIGGGNSPEFNLLATINQLSYESKIRVLGARLGFIATLPLVLLSHVTDNPFGFSSSGAGWADLRLDFYLQWDPIMYHGRAIYVNSFDFGAYFPTGQHDFPNNPINPGTNTYAVNPYWAATAYLTQDWTVSWRVYYLWMTENPIIQLQAGDCIHVNYNTEYKFTERFHVGINGYYLQQLHDNKLFGQTVPNSRERVVGFGPGAFYYLPRNFILLGHLYGEFDVRNRPKGVSLVVRFIKFFG